MNPYIRPHIQSMSPYVPGEQPQEPGFIKLNTNENPYPPSPKVIEAVRRAADEPLRLYPDPVSTRLREKLGKVYGIDPACVIVGNGSDELLSMILKATVEPGEIVSFPVPTYSLYETLASIARASINAVPYEMDYSLPERFFKVKSQATFLCNPNAPSGTLLEKNTVRRLAQSVGGVLAVDEAYADFAESNCLDLARTCKNVVILRTLSKSFSLAGVRIGFAIGSRPLIDALYKIKDSYNINRLSMAAAEAALEDLPHARANIEKIKKTRGRLAQEIQKLGFEVYPSQTNFLMIKCPRLAAGMQDANLIYEELKKRKILIRYFKAPRLEDKLRITIGTDWEIDVLLKTLSEIMRP